MIIHKPFFANVLMHNMRPLRWNGSVHKPTSVVSKLSALSSNFNQNRSLYRVSRGIINTPKSTHNLAFDVALPFLSFIFTRPD